MKNFETFPLKRGIGFESELERLFDICFPNGECQQYENETFEIFPYYWGDCTCGFDEIECPIEHINCYQNEFENEKLKNGWKKDEFGYLEYTGKDSSESFNIENKIALNLCKKYNLSYSNLCLVHCTCNYNERYEKWLNEIGYPNKHKDNCLLVKANFHYKPTNFEIRWYKYPLRNSYTNKKITLEEFKKIMDDCISNIQKV